MFYPKGCAFDDGDRGWDSGGVATSLEGCDLRDDAREGLVLEPEGDRKDE